MRFASFMQTESDGQVLEVNEKQLLRKIGWMIMPMMFGVYVFQYMDKSLSEYI